LIDIVQHTDERILSQVKDYLATALESWGAAPEHDPRWLEVLRNGLGHQTFMLIARDGHAQASVESSPAKVGVSPAGVGKICGYLPLALVSSRLFGRFLVSLPYVNRAGVVARDRSVASELVGCAIALAQTHKVNYLELRSHGPLDPSSKLHPSLGVSRSNKVRMVLPLPDTGQDLWNIVSAKVRNQVRKGQKNQLQIRWGGLELLDAFYEVFSVNMRDLGTPVYPKGLFASILEQFEGQAELSVVDLGDRVAAAALLVHAQGVTQVPSASSLRCFHHANPNMWMYHQLLLRAVDRGSRAFDFGRSSEGSGTYRFKKQWGAQPHPTLWQYHVLRGRVDQMRPDSPHNRWRVSTWKKLPVWLTRRIGPVIVRGIP